MKHNESGSPTISYSNFESKNSWDDFAKEYTKIHTLDLEQVRTWFIPLLEFAKENYNITKK